jgi:holo-[acyl-carrier protein] synthase
MPGRRKKQYSESLAEYGISLTGYARLARFDAVFCCVTVMPAPPVAPRGQRPQGKPAARRPPNTVQRPSVAGPRKVILGVGLDMVAVVRFEREVARHGDGFLEELFSASEIAYCRQMMRPYQYYAARFAAREALFKALGTGRTGRIGWRDVEVVRDESGKPSLVLAGEAGKLADSMGVRRIHVSLTHTDEFASAVVVLED